MARKPLDAGQRFDYRVGTKGYTLGGIMKDADTGSTPINRPRMIINGRFQGGGIVSRPPYTYMDFLSSQNQILGAPGSTTSSNYEWNGQFISEHHPTRINSQLWIGSWNPNTSLPGAPLSLV